MKKVLSIILLATCLARAEDTDQEYIRIYELVAEGETLNQEGKIQAATEIYRKAQTALIKLQAEFPDWNKDVVKFRLNYLNEKLAPTPRTSNLLPAQIVVSNAIPQNNLSADEIRRLQSEKAVLEAKLKEALSARPNGVSPEALAKMEQKVVELQKERDLLKVALEQGSVVPKGETELENKKPLARKESHSKQEPKSIELQNNNEVEQLRARLSVLEARPMPFTAEELALFVPSEPQLAPANSTPAKKSKELPTGAGALVAQAERAFAARRFDEAEKKYLDVLRQDEKNSYILGNLAATQLELNEIGKAEGNIQRALQIDPDDAFSLTLLGMVKFRQGNFDEALNVLSRSAKVDSQNAETQNYLGITLSQKGQRVAAEAALRAAIKLQPNYAGAHHNLAVIYATQRPAYIELARWHYQKALTLGQPKSPDLEKVLTTRN